uniref:Wsv409 n=1 Tax=White spot syndrome virus TaxID=92652 RepID=A0A2U9GCE2_WSSV|nr:wsv409 [Shrimp white spot syndrome virus]AWQ63067.1 wsv409 [Shrimp white spot syndrome virus]AWQ63502.1 wsv409 [Shrimp white spot syndrome virus]
MGLVTFNTAKNWPISLSANLYKSSLVMTSLIMIDFPVVSQKGDLSNGMAGILGWNGLENNTRSPRRANFPCL